MFGSQALETAIGLAVMFFILATAASAATEVVSRLMKKRSSDFEKTILDMLSEGISKDAEEQLKWRWGRTNEVKAVRGTAEPFLALLKRTSIWQAAEAAAGRSLIRRKPIGNSYLSAKSFAEAVNEALVSALPKDDKGNIVLNSTEVEKKVAELAEALPDSLQRRLEVLVDEAKHGMLEVKAGLESWFDETMGRAEGAYKRWASLMLFLVGLAFAGLANASTVDIARDLWQDSATRTAVADTATTFAEDQTRIDQLDGNGDDFVSVDEAADALGDIGLPVGWDKNSWAEFKKPDNIGWSALTALGWLVTALLVMLGGPFWFDLLTKLVALRGAGKKPLTAAEDDTSATRAVTARPAAAAGPAATTYPTNTVEKAAQDAEVAAYQAELGLVSAVLTKSRTDPQSASSTVTKRISLPADVEGSLRRGAATVLAKLFNRLVTPPVVTGVDPGEGPAAGDTPVKVTGSGFTRGAEVFFGPNQATAVTKVSKTHLTATAPAATAGEVDVQVKTSAGISDTSAAAKYTYREAPAVTGVEPGEGPAGGGAGDYRDRAGTQP